MDTQELKQLLQDSTTVLVVENGKPAFVVMNYDTYRERAAQGPVAESQVALPLEGASPSPVTEEAAPVLPEPTHEAELLERLNKEILALKTQIEIEEKKVLEWQGE